MFIDGIEFAGHAVIIALGVTIDGTKEPLGIWAGSTENTTVATALLSDLVDRGLRVEDSMLFVIDGGKAIRKALRDVFGDRAIVQRCQVLCRTFATTNAIENMNGSLRPIARNVKRWKDEKMIRRWVALGIAEAQRGFRRVKGHRDMPSLVVALRPVAKTAADNKKVA